MEYKNKNQIGKIESLFRYLRKKDSAIEEEQLLLIDHIGIDGDFHADGGDRQVSILSKEEKDWMNEQEQQGICFRKFKENILIEGISLATCKPGDLFICGEVILEVTDVMKQCYPEVCELETLPENCIFIGSYRFVKVNKGGVIKKGMEIIRKCT